MIHSTLKRIPVLIHLLIIIIWYFLYNFVFKQYVDIDIYWYLTAAVFIGLANTFLYDSKKAIIISSIIVYIIVIIIISWINYNADKYPHENVLKNILTGDIRWDSYKSLEYFFTMNVYNILALSLSSLLLLATSYFNVDSINSKLDLKEILKPSIKYGYLATFFALVSYLLVYDILSSIEYVMFYNSLLPKDKYFWPVPDRIITLYSIFRIIVFTAIQIGFLYYLSMKRMMKPIMSIGFYSLTVFILILLDKMASSGYNKYLSGYALGITFSVCFTLIILSYFSNKTKNWIAFPASFLLLYLYNLIISTFLYNPKNFFDYITYRYELLLIILISALISGITYKLCAIGITKITHANTRS